MKINLLFYYIIVNIVVSLNIICIRLCMNEFFLRISANDEPGSDNDAGYQSPPYSAHYLGRMLIGGTTTPHIIPKPQEKLY